MVFRRMNRSHEKAAESSKLKPYHEIHGFHEIYVFQVIRKLSSFLIGDSMIGWGVFDSVVIVVFHSVFLF